MNLSNATNVTLPTNGTLATEGNVVTGIASSDSYTTGNVQTAYQSAKNYSDSLMSEPTFLGNVTVSNNLIISSGNLILNSMTFPAVDGTNGQALTTNGTGGLSWTTIAGGGGASANLHLVGDITTKGNITFWGSYDTIINLSNSTNIQLPSSGTLTTLTGTETLTNKTLVSPSVTGTLTVSDNLSVGGNIYISGNILVAAAVSGNVDIGSLNNPIRRVYSEHMIMISDGRKKTDIENLKYGLNEILKMRPVLYNWKHGRNKNKVIGLIAQEVQPLVEEVVSEGEDKDKSLGIQYSNIVPVLIKAIQEQEEIIQTQKDIINGQNKRLDNIETILLELKKAQK